jgi:type I restriction enzyme S subunit
MPIKLKQYLKYKDSKVDFLGNIPKDWNVYRLKFLLSALESGKREPEEETPFENGAFSLGGEHVNWDGTLKLDNLRLVSEEFYNSMNQGKIKIHDILLVKDGATIGKTALVKKKEYDKMAVNEHVFILRFNKRLIPRLLYYLVYSDCGFSQIKLTETGSAQGGVNSEFTSKVTFSISEDSKEQKQIADFLDKKITDINNLLERDKQLIELLKEKRIALINHVVTKGLNPKAKFKESGIDWIGKIPEGWKINKIKNTSYVKGRIGWQGLTSEEYSDKGAYLVTGTDFKEGKINWESCHHVSLERYKEDPYIHLKENDLLITKDGTIGKIALIDKIPDKATLNSGIFLVRPLNKEYQTRFMYWILNSLIFERFFDYIKTGATISHLYQETFERFFFPISSKTEQTQIVEYLDKTTSKIDEAVKRIEKRIEFLEEYKKSLIHYVVTGKVDVRNI